MHIEIISIKNRKEGMPIEETQKQIIIYGS